MRGVALSLCLALAFAPSPAHALAWPDVPERVERDLASSDPAVRRLAVERIGTLGATRATPFLLRALADADATVRVAAAEAAIRARARVAVELVIPWLAEPDARLRLAACEVTRALPDPRAVGPLARALSDTDGAVRSRAVEALGAQTSPDAVAPLLGKLDDSNPEVRIAIARALARIGDPRAVVPLIGKVEDSAADVRRAVAAALGELGDPRATPALILQLRDASAEVRVGALAAIARVDGVEAVDAIAPLTLERDAAVRKAALATLGLLARGGSKAALGVLLGRLGVDEDAAGDLEPNPVRDALASSARPGATLPGAHFPHASVTVTTLGALLLRGASSTVSTSIAWILGAIGDPASAAPVVVAWRRGTLPAAAALHALVAVGSPNDLPMVLELIADDNPTVRGQAFVAARALLDPRHPDGRAVDPLLAVAEGTKLSVGERVKVIELLGRTAARRAAPVLQGLVAAKDASIRLAAVDALADLGPTGADASLLPLLGDHDPVVRLHASAALAASGGAAARDALLRRLEDGPALDRAAALSALGGILERAPSEAAWTVLESSLELAAGGERDAILLALGRGAPVHPVLERRLATPDADDRRTLATAFAGRADAVPLLRRLLTDSDASVRAQAAWSLGGAPDGAVLPDLDRIMNAKAEGDAAVDAAAAVGRIVARGDASRAAGVLCPRLADGRPLVRANVAASLALSGVRCGDGAGERALLSDPSELVRMAAARALRRAPSGNDSLALAKCAAIDPSGDVAHACERAPERPRGAPHPALAYVEGTPRTLPQPHAAYLVELADGLLRAGTADRQGAFFDPVAPDGALSLRLAAP